MDFLADFARQYAALIVSICALFLTIQQAKATRKHNRLTVRPHLTSFSHRGSDPKRSGVSLITATLSNNGLGPAIIKAYEPLLDGNPIDFQYPEDLFSVVEKAIPVSLLTNECLFTTLRRGYVMGKDETVTLAKIVYVPTIHDDPEALKEALKRFHIRVTYESGYEEPFVYDSREHLA